MDVEEFSMEFSLDLPFVCRFLLLLFVVVCFSC